MKNSIKRIAAGFLTLAFVAGVAPANVGDFLRENMAIVASAEIEPVIDKLDIYNTNSSTSANNWLTDKEKLSAVYKGYSSANTSYEIKFTKSPGIKSGIVTFNSSRIAKEITVVWGANNKYTLEVYGKNEPYDNVTNLYDSSKGDSIGKITYPNTKLEINQNCQYIGLYSPDGTSSFKSISITWKIDISQATVNLAEDNTVTSLTVDNEAITDLSSFDITYGTDEDHSSTTVPTEPGTYYAYVTPKSTNTDYAGTARSEAFDIASQTTDISQASITFDRTSVVYTGEEITPVVTVTLGDDTLTEGVDYEIADGSTTSATEKGNYTIAINGIGDYSGTASAVWQIVEPKPYTIGVNNGYFSNASGTSAEFAEQSVVTVVGDTLTGHWINQDGNVVSLDRHYSFYAMFDTNLTWVSNEASFEGIANINISNRAYNEATGKTTVNVTSTWDIPKGATIIEAGTLRTASTDQITSEQLQSATYLKKSTLKTTKGTFVSPSI